ncbi:hypothetical protein G0U57_008798, partial [Chelydra serpentina]
QKAESDLDYIQHKLEFEIMKNLPDNPSAEKSAGVLAGIVNFNILLKTHLCYDTCNRSANK